MKDKPTNNTTNKQSKTIEEQNMHTGIQKYNDKHLQPTLTTKHICNNNNLIIDLIGILLGEEFSMKFRSLNACVSWPAPNSAEKLNTQQKQQLFLILDVLKKINKEEKMERK